MAHKSLGGTSSYATEMEYQVSRLNRLRQGCAKARPMRALLNFLCLHTKRSGWSIYYESFILMILEFLSSVLCLVLGAPGMALGEWGISFYYFLKCTSYIKDVAVPWGHFANNLKNFLYLARMPNEAVKACT